MNNPHSHYNNNHGSMTTTTASSSAINPPTIDQVQSWFQQAANGSTAQPLHEWMQVVQHNETQRAAAFSQLLLPLIVNAQLDVSMRFYALSTLARLPATTTPSSSSHHGAAIRIQERHALRQALVYQLDASTLQQVPFWRNKVAHVWLYDVCLPAVMEDRYDNGNNHTNTFVSWMTSDVPHVAHHHPLLFLKWLALLLEAIVLDVSSSATSSSFSSTWDHPHHSTSEIPSSHDAGILKEATRRVKEHLKQPQSTSSSSSSTTVSLRTQWFNMTVQLLQQALTTMIATNTNPTTLALSYHTEMAVLALQAIRAFWAWTDMPITHSSVVWQCLLQGLSSSSSAVQVATLETWYEWMTSMVDQEAIPLQDNGGSSGSSGSNSPLPLITALLEHIHQAQFLPEHNRESAADIEVVIAAAKVINVAGQACLFSWYNETTTTASSLSSYQQSLAQAQRQVLDLFFRAFSYDDIDVSAAVLELATRLVQCPHNHHASIHNGNSSSYNNLHHAPQNYPYVPQILSILAQQMRYPVDFDYDFTDDINAEEEMYREQLDKLYVKMVQVAPAVVLEFLRQQVQSQGSGMTITHSAAEATLRLVYYYCQGIRPAPGVKTVIQNEAFCHLLVTLQQQELIQNGQTHEQVLRWYYETAVRYYPLYQKEGALYSHLLAQLLAALTGPNGLQHPTSVSLRSRCCFLLLRLVKALIAMMAPMVQTAVTGILGLLNNNHNLALRPDDTLYLFETIGLLLGKTGLSPADQQTHLAQIMTPHIHSMEQGILTVEQLSPSTAKNHNFSGTENYGNDDDDDDESPKDVGGPLARCIAALTCLSKGFGKQPPETVQVVLAESLLITLKVLESLPSSEAIRSKSMTYLQRMIQCIGEKALSLVPRFLASLIPHCTADDCVFVAQIFQQVSIKFNAQAVPALDAGLLPFLQKCSSLVNRTLVDAGVSNGMDSPVPPHLQTEKLAIQKLVFTVVDHVVSNRCTELLLTPTNVSSLEFSLRTVAEGLVHVSDPVVRKTCLHVFRELTDQWVRQDKNIPSAYRNGFLTIVYQIALPGLLVAMAKPHFDERDAQQYRVVADFSKLTYALQECGEIDNALRAMYTTAVPAGSLDAFRNATDAKAVENILMARLNEWKRGQN